MIIGRFCYGRARKISPTPRSVCRYLSRHQLFIIDTGRPLTVPSQQYSQTLLRVLTRFSVQAEYACIASRAALTLVCIVIYTLLATCTIATGKLTTCERACQAICSLACCLAKWVLSCTASKVTDALLQLQRIGLVGRGNLVDLAWGVLVGALRT